MDIDRIFVMQIWVTIVAIAFPVIGAVLGVWMKNKNDTKLKTFDLFVSRKIDAIENYIKYASETAYGYGATNNFGEYSSLIFAYAPIALHDKILQLNNRVANTRFDETTLSLLMGVTASLQEQIDIVKTPIKIKI